MLFCFCEVCVVSAHSTHLRLKLVRYMEGEFYVSYLDNVLVQCRYIFGANLSFVAFVL